MSLRCPLGVHGALARDEGFLDGLSVAAGRVTSTVVLHGQGAGHTPAAQALGEIEKGD
jgi:hypothetical protein